MIPWTLIKLKCKYWIHSLPFTCLFKESALIFILLIDTSRSDDGAAQGCPEDDTSVSDKIASDSSSTSTPVASSNMQAPQSSSTPKTPAGGMQK